MGLNPETFEVEIAGYAFEKGERVRLANTHHMNIGNLQENEVYEVARDQPSIEHHGTPPKVCILDHEGGEHLIYAFRCELVEK